MANIIPSCLYGKPYRRSERVVEQHPRGIDVQRPFGLSILLLYYPSGDDQHHLRFAFVANHIGELSEWSNTPVGRVVQHPFGPHPTFYCATALDQ
jgi:hypothetical protein